MRNILKTFPALIFSVLQPVVLSQTTSDGSMPQFLFGGFGDSKVVMKSKQVQTPRMNYNIITGKMVFVRDNKYYDLTNPEMIDTVYLQNCTFLPVGKSFYELLASGKYNLLIQYTGSLLTAGKPVGYGGTSQVSSSNYLSSIQLSGMQYNLPLPADYIVRQETVYWLSKGDEMSGFRNEKQFLKLFPDKSEQLKKFINENRVKFDHSEHIISLVNYLNAM